MAQINENGGGGGGGGKKFWETDDFRERVRRIREKEQQAPQPTITEPKPQPRVEFNLPRNRGKDKMDTKIPPIPVSTSAPTPVKRTSHRTGSSFNQDLYESELEKTVTTQVNKEFKVNMPMGITPEKYKTKLQEEIERRVDIIKRPRYVFLSDGTPYYLDRKDERDDLERSLLSETSLKRRWTMLKYDFANGMTNLLKKLGEPALATKEFLANEEVEGNVIGAIAELGLNSALMAGEILRVVGQPEAMVATEERALKLEQEAEALKYTDPTAAQVLMDQASTVRKNMELKQVYQARMAVAGRAVKESWERLVSETEENIGMNERMLEEVPGATSIEQMKWREEQFIQQAEQAKNEAASLRTEAMTAFQSGDYEKAMEIIEQAQTKDRDTMIADPQSAYSWIREPERYDKFKKDMAFLELQKGEPLSTEEIRRLKEYHANSWTELTGELIFDPLNLIPAVWLEKGLAIPIRGASKANQALVKAFPAYGKTLNVLGSPIRWLRRETVYSGGNRIAGSINGLLERMSSAYAGAEEFKTAMNQVSELVTQAKNAGNEQAARTIFENGKKTSPALEQITFKDFKSLMDAGEHVDPATWAKKYSDALLKAEDDISELAVKQGVDSSAMMDEVSKVKRAALMVASEFRDAFVDAHRIYKGSSFVDDTIAGWATKIAREISGEEVNELLKINKLDEIAIKYGETLDPGWKMFWSKSSKGVENILQATGFLRDVWTTVVLSTPRYLMNNLADTAFRSVVHGGNLWDDLTTLFTSTQRHFADELGVMPTELVQGMARDGLEFSESVPVRLLYEGWKPKAGLFSYWKYEYNRLLGTDPFVARSKIMDGMLSGLPEGKLKNSLAMLGNGANILTSPIAFKSWAGAVSDFNTAIEFTYRLRMFHREYFSLLNKLEPKFMEKGLNGLSSSTKEIAAQIWKSAEGNPRRITAYVEAMTKQAGKKGTPAQWATFVPPEMDKALKGMDVTDRQLFISSVRNEIESFVEASLKSGKELGADDFKKFFDDYKTKFRDEIQARMEKAHDWKEIDTTISKDGKTAEIPNPGELKGSAPVPNELAARQSAIERATHRLNIKTRLQRTGDIAEDFETAISDIAKVERVPGPDVRLVMKGGKPVIEMGEQALKLNKSNFYRQLSNTVIDLVKNTDTDVILRSGFKDLNEYETALRTFLKDKEGPTAILRNNERQFIAIVNELDSHPQLKNLMERLSGEKFQYDAAMDIYRNLGEYSDVYGFTKKPTEIFESEAQRLRPLPGDHVAAAQDSAKSTVDLARLEDTLEPALAKKVTPFRESFGVYREELKQFFAFTYPGPLMKSTRDAERRIGWDKFYKLATEEFKTEKAIKDKLIDLLQNDPAAAEKYLDEASENFAEFFLKENGITLQWDADMQKLMNIKYVSPLDGRTRNITSGPDLAHLQMRFFSKETAKKLANNPVLRLRTDAKTKLTTQLKNNLRDVFQLPDYQAAAWGRVIQNHAEKWAEVTGQDVAKYYERLGFQKLEGDTYGLGTTKDFRVVKRGAVQRTSDGNFIFYGLGQSNFESVVRETSELFFDDLVSMAQHSDRSADDLKNLREFLEKETGRPIFGNKLDQPHSDALTSMFTRYVAEGSGPDIKIKKPFEIFKDWMTDVYDGVKGSPLEQELADETRQIMDRLFIEKQIADVPKSNKRTNRLMAKEAGLGDNEDELLKIINESVPAQRPSAEWQDFISKGAFSDFPSEALDNPQAFQDFLRTQIDEVLDDLNKQYEPLMRDPGITPEIRDNLIARLSTEQEEQLRPYINLQDEARKFIPNTYTKLGDVPKDVAANAFKVTADNKTLKELQEGWEVWKTQRGVQGFPDSALTSPDTFKQYLKDRSLQEWSEPAAHYNRLMWEVEQFEDAMLNYHVGDDFAEVIFPRVPEASISDGMKTFIRNQEQMMNNYESAQQALDTWQEYLIKLSDEGHPGFVLPKEAQAELLNWSKNAANDKAEMIDVLIRGGDVDGVSHTGALDLVNKRMIDYQHSNLFDQFMKNFIPFWKFPSRSFPFWVETMATHPQIIAGYEKIQRLSRSQRYQAKAVTSQGKPLPSLDGYIKLPGTDMWFNPLAPLSFRYVLDISKYRDDAIYEANSQDDVEPKAYLAKEMLKNGPMYGFSLAPWTTYLIKNAYNIPDEIIPAYPLAPEISLIPRWMVQDVIRNMNKINFFGMEIKGLGDAVYPEAPWHDYLVERRILENVYGQITEMPESDPRRRKLLYEATQAIKNKGNDQLWQNTYKEITQEEWTHNMTSFFTGMYPKEFSDKSADMRMLINEMNLLKSAMNNEFQATVFDIPTDAHQAYDKYLNTMGTPEGWVHRLYTDIGWVKNEEGELVRDPQERAKYLAIKIKQDEDQQVYYDKMSDLQSKLNEEIRALPIGAPWEQVKGIYDRYAEQRESLQYLRSFEKYYGTNKPTEIIMEDITKDWFVAVKSSKPSWDIDGGETYDQYQERVKEWEANLPNIAPLMMRAFKRSSDLNNVLGNLKPDQQFDQKFFADLVTMTNAQGIQEWERGNDDVFDALNKAWDATYWGEYWNSVIGSKGYETDLVEKDFYTKHPSPPNAQALYTWISMYYGPDKFTYDEIKKWVDGTDAMTVEERRLSTKDDPQDFQTRQDIWNMLSWVGPGNKNRGVFETAFLNAGGDKDMLTVWYEESGEAYKTQPEKLEKLQASIEEAIKTLGLKEPSRAELVRYVQAQKDNDVFKQLVSDELGNQFFDWKEEDGTPHQGIYSYYNSLDSKAKKEFRSSYPEEYALIEDYKAMRETYGEEHLVWADYYGTETTPSVTLPTNEQGSFLTPPSRYRPRKKPSGDPSYETPSMSFKPRASYEGSSIPQFRIPSRIGGAMISQELLRLVGDKMAWEISQMMSSGRPLSSSGQSFLRSLASRYPKFRSQINGILGSAR